MLQYQLQYESFERRTRYNKFVDYLGKVYVWGTGALYNCLHIASVVATYICCVNEKDEGSSDTTQTMRRGRTSSVHPR